KFPSPLTLFSPSGRYQQTATGNLEVTKTPPQADPPDQENRQRIMSGSRSNALRTESQNERTRHSGTQRPLNHSASSPKLLLYRRRWSATGGAERYLERFAGGLTA